MRMGLVAWTSIFEILNDDDDCFVVFAAFFVSCVCVCVCVCK